MAQLTCQRLCVGYDGQSVLQDLTFELLAGDYLCKSCRISSKMRFPVASINIIYGTG